MANDKTPNDDVEPVDYGGGPYARGPRATTTPEMDGGRGFDPEAYGDFNRGDYVTPKGEGKKEELPK